MSALSRTCRIQHFHAMLYAYRLIILIDRVFLQNVYVSSKIYFLLYNIYLPTRLNSIGQTTISLNNIFHISFVFTKENI